MSSGKQRPPGPELLVLTRWEEFMGWFLPQTNRWPKSLRFTLCQRVQDHGLDIVELLVGARYDRNGREQALAEANLKLEKIRILCRLAMQAQAMPAKSFETAMRGVDETGRMLHGWRERARGSKGGTP
jgi:hypothetical protein